MNENLLKGSIGIIARMGSQRLLNKHLIQVNAKPIISYLIQRLYNEFKSELKRNDLKLYILTGSFKLNRPLLEIAQQMNVSIFFGDDANIPKRMLEFLENEEKDFLISVDGDDILCAPEGIRSIYQLLSNGSAFCKTINYPFGMNSSGYSKPFLTNSLKKIDSSKSLETGWGWIFDEKKCEIVDSKLKNNNKLRFTLDYPEDLSFFKKIITSDLNIYNTSTKEIIDFVIEENIFLENENRNKEYWDNFNYEQSLEIKGVNNG